MTAGVDLPSRGFLRPAMDLLAPLRVVFCREPPACWGRFSWVDNVHLNLRRAPGGTELAALSWLHRRHAGATRGIFCWHPAEDVDPASVWERLLARGDLPPALGPDPARSYLRAEPNGDFPPRPHASDLPADFGDAVSYASDVPGMLAAEGLAAEAVRRACGRSPRSYAWWCGERGGWPGDPARARRGHGLVPLLAAAGGRPTAIPPERRFRDPCGVWLEFAQRAVGLWRGDVDGPLEALRGLGYALLDFEPESGAVTLWRPTLFEVTWPYGRTRRARTRAAAASKASASRRSGPTAARSASASSAAAAAARARAAPESPANGAERPSDVPEEATSAFSLPAAE